MSQVHTQSILKPFLIFLPFSLSDSSCKQPIDQVPKKIGNKVVIIFWHGWWVVRREALEEKSLALLER